MKILMSGFTSLQVGPERRGDIRKIDVPGTIAAKLREGGHDVDWRPVSLGEDLDGYDAAWVNLARPISMNSRVGALGAMWTLAQGVPCVGYYDDWQSPITVQNDFSIMSRRPGFVQKHIIDSKALRLAAGVTVATYLDRAPALAEAERGRAVLRDLEYSEKDIAELHAYRFFEERGVTPDDMYARVETHRPQLERLISAMADGARWSAGMVPVCPMYRWGDRSVVQRILPAGSADLIPLDPSEIAYDVVESWRDEDYRRGGERDTTPEKKREWLLAALVAHDGWLKKQKFEWPVWNTGSRNMIKKMGKGERLFAEIDVVQKYAEHWGILSPPYREHAGSGWWRSRFIYAAATSSVLVGHPTEVGALGAPYDVTISEVEAMSDATLVGLAERQAEVMAEYAPLDGDILHAAEKALKQAILADRWEG